MENKKVNKQRLTTYLRSDYIFTLKRYGLDHKKSVASILEELVRNFFETNNIEILSNEEPL